MSNPHQQPDVVAGDLVNLGSVSKYTTDEWTFQCYYEILKPIIDSAYSLRLAYQDERSLALCLEDTLTWDNDWFFRKLLSHSGSIIFVRTNHYSRGINSTRNIDKY
jgi:hypothetical protein